CRAAIHAHSDSGLGAVRIRGSSKITGFDMQASTASIYQLRSIGIGGTGAATEIIVSDSLVAGAANPGTSQTNGAYRVGIDTAGQTLTVARSKVWTMNQSPDWTFGSPEGAFGSGAQIAISAAGRRTVVHNSVVRASGGGGATFAIAAGSSNAELDVIQSTLVIGDNFNGGVGRVDRGRGADLVVGGTPTRINLRNSLFSYGGVGTPSFNTILSALDFSGLGSAVQCAGGVQKISSVGNVFSIGAGLDGNIWSDLFCFKDEFGYFKRQDDMNYGGNYACYSTGYSASYSATGNHILHELSSPPRACRIDGDCVQPYSCLPATNTCAVSEAPVAELALTGQVTSTNLARQTLQTTALPLGVPDDSTWTVDITGAQRSGASRQHVGAYTIP
ncbi:MAG TPA: hypothetical protein VF331_12815, partial [Polyangiales bacterium]